MPSIYLPCPQCGEEIECLMEWERGDYSVGLFGGWEVSGYVGSCDCLLTADEDDALGDEAMKRANADAEFGVTIPENAEPW
jgi:hypothetical protein